MRRSYPWEGKEAPRETFVKSSAFGYIAFGLLFSVVGWLTKSFAPFYGGLFVAFGLGYYAGAGAAFRRIEQH